MISLVDDPRDWTLMSHHRPKVFRDRIWVYL